MSENTVERRPAPATNIHSWATDLDEDTLAQAQRTASLPILAGPIALMPDAHLGYGATIGSVIATRNTIIPSAVGVDVGCGMHAQRLALTADDLSHRLGAILAGIEKAVPAGMGQAHEMSRGYAAKWLEENTMPKRFTEKQRHKAASQLGTLGSGNHFIELSVDQDGGVWVVLHSGSRGIGNEIASAHIKQAKKDFASVIEGYELEDPQLAWLVEGTQQFAAYWADLQWLQRYAAANRTAMLLSVLSVIGGVLEKTVWVTDSVSCHHNYAEIENHHGEDVFVTRKGAIDASLGKRGIIPGSMGASTFLTRGKGNPDSWRSSSHGAGRKLSRTKAKSLLSVESLREQMSGRTWLDGKAEYLLDEHPDSYKNIEDVMVAQADLVSVTHRLDAVLNYKGSK